MSFKDLFVTEEPAPAKPATRAPLPTPDQVHQAFVSTVLPSYQPSAVPDSSPAYQRLLKATDKKSLPVYDQVRRFMEPLEGVIADENIRLKAALAQTAAASNIQMDSMKANFLNGLDGLLAKLDAEKQGFETYAEQKVQKDVKGNEANIADITQKQADIQAQITALQITLAEFEKKKGQLHSDVIRAQQSIETTRQEFQAAYDRRKSELERQKAEYQTLLA
jgi:hypothetical protein